MRQSRILYALIFSLALGACSKAKPDSVIVDRENSPTNDQSNVGDQVRELSHVIKEHDLYKYPALTTLISSPDTEDVKAKLQAVGAKVTYDPNLGRTTRIPFLIVEMAPELLLDEDFITSLGLSAINISMPGVGSVKPLQANDFEPERAFEDTVYVPVEDIKVPEFREHHNNGEDLGDDVLVAVIDTGIDATHPVFQNRVVYWSDQTEETSVSLTNLNSQELTDAVFTDGVNQFQIPEEINLEATVYRGVIDESLFSAQLGDADRVQGLTGIDLNRNGSRDDKFTFVLGQSLQSGDWTVFADERETGVLSPRAIRDFNLVRSEIDVDAAEQSLEGMLVFSDQNRVIAYPLMILENENHEPSEIRLGLTNGSHGTHVAGIIGGNGQNVKGVAPKAHFMSLRVCSNITCTTDAILRAMIEAFYNPQGLIPDVVNISLGSHQRYQQDIFDYVMRDLSSKFGTVFVISASNSGPGYRTLNSIGALAPIVQVGAHVSKRTLNLQYTLDPAVYNDMPMHNLLFFSSLGPSYTGHLRPNVIAPGSAISSTALNETGSEMFNGTSMSAPITTGSIAALLSVAKKDSRFETVKSRRENFIANVLGPQVPQERSLLGFSLAVRTALENSAEMLPYYTFAQQGYGLLDVDNTYENLIALTNEWSADQVSLFEVKVNNNSKSSRLYKRSLKIDPVAQISISLEDDGERGDVHKQLIRNTPIQVLLERVQVQAPNGTVTTLTGSQMPFAVGTPGVVGENATEGTILLASNRRRDFYSIRKLDQMTPGNVYLAHYVLQQNGVRVQSLLDVVHMPLDFSEQYVQHEIPSIDPDGRMTNLALSWKNVAIGTNEFHRYPVAVNKLDSALIVEAGISVEQAGSLYVQVFDPDGEEADFQVILRSSEHTMNNPTTKIVVPTAAKDGIYEVVLSSSNWRWMGPTHYDMIVSKERLKLSDDSLKLGLNTEKILSVSHPNVITNIDSVSSSALHPLIELPKVPVLPSRWTFQILALPNGVGAWTKLDLFVPESENKGSLFFGRIDHHLYTMNTDGSFESFATATASKSSEMKRVFENINSSETEIYFAVETYGVIAETGELSDAFTNIPVHAVLTGSNLAEILDVSLSSDSNADLSLVRIKTPATLSNSLDAWSLLSLKVNNGKTLDLPVVLKQQ